MKSNERNRSVYVEIDPVKWALRKLSREIARVHSSTSVSFTSRARSAPNDNL
jgi:hypothetical protein